jgi:PhnB protein
VKEIVTYLSFDGQTREAMQFYAKALGGELMMMSGADMPAANCPADFKDRILHARLTKGNRSLLMASDTPPGMPYQAGSNFSVSVHCESLEEIQRLFAAIGEGGTVQMPLADMFWGAHWGTLRDRYGIQWMFNYEYPKQG